MDTIIENHNPDCINLHISLREILYRCILNAWYPINVFKLKLDKDDKILDHIKKLKEIPELENFFKQSIISYKDFATKINSLQDNFSIKEIYAHLKKNVPFRFLSPWIEHSKLEVDKHYTQKFFMNENYDPKFLLPYKFYWKENEIQLEISSWFQTLLSNNKSIIEHWWRYNFAKYIQDKNPLMPGILSKLEKMERDQSVAKIFWQPYLQKRGGIDCIYTRKKLTDSYDMDHFIPWSFVGHNLLWNIIPVDSEFNRVKKSDKLPNLKKYLSSFLDAQLDCLFENEKILLHTYAMEKDYIQRKNISNRIIEDYELKKIDYKESLRINHRKIRESIEEKISNSHDLAIKNEFEEFSF
jgi:hypothetical protein